jgi:hypothetical protein
MSRGERRKVVAVRADGGGDGGVGLDERDVGDVAEENDGPEQFRGGHDSNLPSIFIYKSVVDIEYKAFVA